MTIAQLHQRFEEYPKACTDTRNITPNSIFFALKGDNFNGNAYADEALAKGAALAVVDEAEYAQTDRHILVGNVLETLQQLANYHRKQCKARVLALTGSNGKTTSKELIHAVLSKNLRTVATKGNLNNHIGVPLTLLEIRPETELAIVEMGANHQGEIAFLCDLAAPDFGYITNFGKAHLEGFGGISGVIKGKSELYDYLMGQQKFVFLNADDPIQVDKLAKYTKKIGFSQNNPQYYNIKLKTASPFVQLEFEGELVSTQLVGRYNFPNCCAAVVIGKYFGSSPAQIKDALEGYCPNNNRSQLMELHGHQILLDAYNANPTSMQAALENFSQMEGGNKVVILGDMFELGQEAELEHQKIAELASSLQFDRVLLVGQNFYKTEGNSQKTPDFNSLKKLLAHSPLAAGSHILVKGSRGMALERLLEVL